MSRVDDRVKAEINELVQVAERLSRDASRSDSALGPQRIEELQSIASRGGQLIRRLYGSESQYRNNLDRVLATNNFAAMHSNYYEHVSELAGILKGIQSDVNRGMLEDVRLLVRAEVFASFLEMAEYLLDEGYKDAAAVILGGVLEDSLRTLAVRKGVSAITVLGKPLTIDPLNIALAKAGVYNPLVQKQITSWATLRNDAAHGQFAKYDADQVRLMLLFVQKFCADYLL
jgi:hypothetical protein